jgi:hypothetical protein
MAFRTFEPALSRFSHSIQTANVRLAGINGSDHDGAEKPCRLVLRFGENLIMVIEKPGSEVSRFIDRVADHPQHGVSRQTSRVVGFDRHRVPQSNLLAASI